MAKAVYVQKGDNIDFTAAEAVGYMDVVPLEDKVGVAMQDIPAGGTGTVALTGAYAFPAVTGTALKVGQKVYWDAANGVITNTATSNTFAGHAITAKVAAGNTVTVRLG